jgi:hypothetical protein
MTPPKTRENLHIVQVGDEPPWKAPLKYLRQKNRRSRERLIKMNRDLIAMAERDMRATSDRRKGVRFKRLAKTCKENLSRIEAQFASTHN